MIPQQSSEWSELRVTSKGPSVRICLVNRNINEDWRWGEEGMTSVRVGESDVCVCSWLPCPHGCALDGSREQTHRQGVEGQRRVTLEQLRPEPKRGQDWEPLYANPQLPTARTRTHTPRSRSSCLRPAEAGRLGHLKHLEELGLESGNKG